MTKLIISHSHGLIYNLFLRDSRDAQILQVLDAILFSLGTSIQGSFVWTYIA